MSCRSKLLSEHRQINCMLYLGHAYSQSAAFVTVDQTIGHTVSKLSSCSIIDSPPR